MEKYVKKFLGAYLDGNYQRAYKIFHENQDLVAKLNNLTLAPELNGNDILLCVHSDFIAKRMDKEAIELYDAIVMSGNEDLVDLLNVNRFLHRYARSGR
nr:hypothetical protein [Candidatus Woesearchaeota archaeon]